MTPMTMKLVLIVVCVTMLVIGLKVQIGRNRHEAMLKEEATRMRAIDEQNRRIREDEQRRRMAEAETRRKSTPLDIRMDRIERKYYLEILWNEEDGWKLCKDGNDLKAVYGGNEPYPFRTRKITESVIGEIKAEMNKG